MKWIERTLYGILVLICLSCQLNPYKQGERLYGLHCANCHMEEGQGMASLYPPLNTPEFGQFSSSFSCIVRMGMSDTLRIGVNEYVFPMPAMPALNPVEITNIYNYITHKWHPDLQSKTLTEVESDLDNCTK